MPEVSFEGQKANYLYGYSFKEEPLPADWVKTWRPCMECASAVTYIDSEKVWHCLKCGWRSDEGMRYSEGEIQMIVDGLAEGKMVKAIAKELGRDQASVSQKIHNMRASGLFNGVVDCTTLGADKVSQIIPKPTYPTDPVGTALQEARKLGFELVSLCVNKPTATFVFTLDLGNGGRA